MDDTYLHTIPETISASESITVSSDSTIDSSEEDYSGYSSLDDELELSDEKSSTSSSYSSMDIDLDRIPIKSQRETNYQAPSSTTSKKQQQQYTSKFDRNNYEFSQPSNMHLNQSSKQDTSSEKTKKREKEEQSTAVKKSTNPSSKPLSRTYNDSFLSSYPTQYLSSPSSDEELYVNYFNQENKNEIEEAYPLPSPITQTVDELVKGERKFSQDSMTYREKKEYNLLQNEYKQNEKTIDELRKELSFYSKQYVALKKQQRNDLSQVISTDKEYLQKYKVEELKEMKKNLSTRFEERQKATIKLIEENYEKPVNIMYKKAQAIAQNKNRSWFGRILFSIVLILEFVWNWIKQQWNHYTGNSQKEKTEKKPVKSSSKRKAMKSKPEKKKVRKSLKRTLKIS